MRFRKSREIEGAIKQTTLTKEGKGWFVSFSCEIEKENIKLSLNKEKAIGIDLGLKSFATFAVGNKNHLITIENPKFSCCEGKHINSAFLTTLNLFFP